MYRASRRARCDRAIRHARWTGRRIQRRCGRCTGRVIGRQMGCRAAARRAARSLSVDDEYFLYFFRSKM